MTDMPYTVELCGLYRSAGRQVTCFWTHFGPFPTKRQAWDFIKSYGYTAADKGEKWLAYPATAED